MSAEIRARRTRGGDAVQRCGRRNLKRQPARDTGSQNAIQRAVALAIAIACEHPLPLSTDDNGLTIVASLRPAERTKSKLHFQPLLLLLLLLRFAYLQLRDGNQLAEC